MILSFIPALQMSLSSMEEDIIGGLTPATEPQLNIMHANYLLMQCCSQPSAADVAKQFSSALHLKYFSENSMVIISILCVALQFVITILFLFWMQNKDMCPRLSEVAVVGMDLLLVATSSNPNASQSARSYLDGLFAFFFSMHRTEINIEDCRWFLEAANKHATSNIHQANAAADDTNPFVNCASFKLYLSRMLGKADILNEQLFNSQVSLQLQSSEVLS